MHVPIFPFLANYLTVEVAKDTLGNRGMWSSPEYFASEFYKLHTYRQYLYEHTNHAIYFIPP